MADVEVKLLGVKQLAKQLKHLGGKGAIKALRAGVGKALAVLRKSIKKQIPAAHKSIGKSVGSKVKINKQDGVVAKVGLNIGKKKGKGRAPHAMIYVGGTADRKTKSGKPTGRMPANPVVQKGLAAGEGQATREMVAKMHDTIKKEAGKT